MSDHYAQDPHDIAFSCTRGLHVEALSGRDYGLRWRPPIHALRRSFGTVSARIPDAQCPDCHTALLVVTRQVALINGGPLWHVHCAECNAFLAVTEDIRARRYDVVVGEVLISLFP